MRRVFNNIRNLQIASALLSAFGLFDSLYLWYTKVSNSEIICTPGSQCDVVNMSPYSVLLGIPVAAIGAAGYAALLALALWALLARDNAPEWIAQARLIFAGVGLFFAAYLTGIEAFILRVY
jgi:uncharacterized membrane protein